MNDAMKFICRITSNGANQGAIDSFSGLLIATGLLLFYSR